MKPMRMRQIKGHVRRGVAAVETAVVLPFMMLLLFGIWEVGQLLNVTQMVSNSAREGARLAATGLYNASSILTQTPNQFSSNSGPLTFQVQSAVANYMQNSGLPMSGTGGAIITITVTNVTRGVTCTAQVTPNSSTGISQIVAVTQSGSAPPYDPCNDSTVQQYDVLQVSVAYPFSFARWSPSNLFFFLGANPTVYAKQTWLCMKDIPITVNTTIPGGPLP